MSNLIFIMADSDAFLRDEVIRITKEWGLTTSSIRMVEEWNPTLGKNSVSLFGEVYITHLDLSDANKLKNFVSFIDNKENKKHLEGNWFGKGLIITSTHAKGAKKVETLVEKSGGKVFKKAKPEEMKEILLSRLSLSKDNKEYLDAFAGNDYQILLGIVNELSKLSAEEQKNLSVEDLSVRLPGKPGSLPPWEFINPLLEGNTQKAIELYQRSAEGSHVLVTMKLARTKLQMLYRLKGIQMAGIWKSAEQAAILGERNGPNIWIADKLAKKISVNTAEYIAKLALKTEADLKGHSRIDPDLIFKNFIAQVCLAIKENKSFPL